jgi:hypothetical protein
MVDVLWFCYFTLAADARSILLTMRWGAADSKGSAVFFVFFWFFAFEKFCGLAGFVVGVFMSVLRDQRKLRILPTIN